MTSRARQTPLARCFSLVHWFAHLLPPKLPADSLRAVEMVVLLLPTQILPSSRLTEPRGWLPERPGESLCALEMVVLLLPTQILPSSRLTEPRELLPDWPQPLVKLLRLSPQALVFGALEKLPSARPVEARWLLPELVRVLLGVLPPDPLRAVVVALLLRSPPILPFSALTLPLVLLLSVLLPVGL